MLYYAYPAPIIFIMYLLVKLIVMPTKKAKFISINLCLFLHFLIVGILLSVSYKEIR